ncbi:energy-coupling factor transporter transmembrane protein EcfT [Roseibium sp.]|uniref:energy-coupling factor transporter transmembrane component T family protein n=1 Tax=Roseibium sp. TaxID=1936156 RepID=UPI003297F63D
MGLYVDTDSPIHRLHAGVKLSSLVVVGTAVFLLNEWLYLAAVLLATVALYFVARIPLKVAYAQLRPVLYLLAIIFIVQSLFDHWTMGVTVALRFLCLILFASLITLTTRVSEMVDVIESAMQPFTPFGVNPAKTSLAISLAIRFLPVIAQKFHDVREAQNARGLGGSIVATAVPLIVRTLRMANDIAEALDARSYDADAKHNKDARAEIISDSRAFTPTEQSSKREC